MTVEAGGASWIECDGPEKDVVLSTRVRLARNVAGFPFLSKAREDQRRQIMGLVQKPILGGDLGTKVIWVDLEDLPILERNLLVERHLISKQHAKGEQPRAVAVSTPDESLSIMVNEEDHLRIQVIRPGLALSDAFERICDVDDLIEASLDYAFSSRFGYLTACPTNVGTGLRVSAMVHLPGLKMTGEIDKVKRAAKSMNVAVRGFYGEGSEAAGDLYQLSNQVTLGRTEHEVLENFEREFVPTVIEYERLARRTLFGKRRIFTEDKVWRALGVLRHARLLKADEALELLSAVRLGVSLDLIDTIPLKEVHRLILLSQSAHLQRSAGTELDQAARRRERARFIREHFDRNRE